MCAVVRSCDSWSVHVFAISPLPVRTHKHSAILYFTINRVICEARYSASLSQSASDWIDMYSPSNGTIHASSSEASDQDRNNTQRDISKAIVFISMGHLTVCLVSLSTFYDMSDYDDHMTDAQVEAMH